MRMRGRPIGIVGSFRPPPPSYLNAQMAATEANPKARMAATEADLNAQMATTEADLNA